MIQQTETRFRINDWKNYSYFFFFFFQSPKHTIVNQLHMYDGIGYKQDKEQTREKERKIKNKSDRFLSDFTVLVCV